MRLDFYRAIFFLRVLWPWVHVRYIPLDLGNVLETNKKIIFRRLKKFWGRFEVDWPTSVHPTTHNESLKILISEQNFDFFMELGFHPRHFFLRVLWPWIDVCYIPPDLGNILEAYKKYFDVWKNFELDLKFNSWPPNHSQWIFENLDFRADFWLFHGGRFLPRHFFSTCRMTMNRCALHFSRPRQFLRSL